MQGEEQTRGIEGGAISYTAPLFVAAAHELKAPLALVRQLALTIEDGDCTPADVQKYAHQISLTSERALRMTTGLTKASRLEDSLFSLEPLNPVSLCEEVVEELAPLYNARGKRLQMAPRQRPLLALANRDLLRRILMNFADNALHYSDEETPVVITAKSYDNGSTIRLGVRDYGPALPAKLWRRMEKSLGRHAQPLHNRPESSGIGMYISSQFAQAMDAEVGATRHRDGATFYVDVSASTQMRLL